VLVSADVAIWLVALLLVVATPDGSGTTRRRDDQSEHEDTTGRVIGVRTVARRRLFSPEPQPDRRYRRSVSRSS
jgi:Tfp pilus assembly protein FimT